MVPASTEEPDLTVDRTRPSSTLLVLVDIQEGPMDELPSAQQVAIERAAKLLLQAAAELRAPVIATEQEPDELGRTIDPIRTLLADGGITPIEKLTFSACNEPAFVDKLKHSAADAAVVVGVEAHVCVFQTVRDLVARGLRVDVAVDGVGSRRAEFRDVGLGLCERAGAVLTTAETVLFDWLVQAGTDSFRKLAPLVRDDE